MPRPRKENLDYFPFDVDFFSDKKIKRVRAKFGTNGIVVYLYLLCEIYHNGYCIEYDDDLILDISDEFNLSENATMQIMNYLFSRSLLRSIPAGSVKIITAESVQRRYQEAKKVSIKKMNGAFSRDIIVDERIWLLQAEETESFIKVRPAGGFSGENERYSGKNESRSEKKHTKESKEKESKVKENKEKESKEVCAQEIPCLDGSFDVDESFLSELTHTFPELDVEKSLNALRIFLLSNPEKQRDHGSVRGQILWWLSGDEERGKYRRNKPVSGNDGAYDLELFEKMSVLDEEW